MSVQVQLESIAAGPLISLAALENSMVLQQELQQQRYHQQHQLQQQQLQRSRNELAAPVPAPLFQVATIPTNPTAIPSKAQAHAPAVGADDIDLAKGKPRRHSFTSFSLLRRRSVPNAVTTSSHSHISINDSNTLNNNNNSNYAPVSNANLNNKPLPSRPIRASANLFESLPTVHEHFSEKEKEKEKEHINHYQDNNDELKKLPMDSDHSQPRPPLLRTLQNKRWTFSLMGSYSRRRSFDSSLSRRPLSETKATVATPTATSTIASMSTSTTNNANTNTNNTATTASTSTITTTTITATVTEKSMDSVSFAKSSSTLSSAKSIPAAKPSMFRNGIASFGKDDTVANSNHSNHSISNTKPAKDMVGRPPPHPIMTVLRFAPLSLDDRSHSTTLASPDGPTQDLMGMINRALSSVAIGGSNREKDTKEQLTSQEFAITHDQQHQRQPIIDAVMAAVSSATSTVMDVSIETKSEGPVELTPSVMSSGNKSSDCCCCMRCTAPEHARMSIDPVLARCKLVASSSSSSLSLASTNSTSSSELDEDHRPPSTEGTAPGTVRHILCSVYRPDAVPTASAFKKRDGSVSIKSGNQLLRFNEEVLVGETHSIEDYARKGDLTLRLTPDAAMSIKRELNEFKQIMHVHEESRVFTHFFKI